MAPFEKGRQKTGGRVKGARNRIAYKLIEALAKDFEEHGEEAIRIARIERPHEYLKIIVSTMPKELEITDSRLQDISDDELELLIEHVRQQRGAIRSTDSREEQTIN